MKQIKRFFLILTALCLLMPAGRGLAASPIQDKLKASIDQILSILRDPDLKGEENTQKRRELLREVINQRFSFAKMSQLSLARHWKKRTDEEKKNFVVLFGQLLEDTYISKIESYTDEEVVFVKELIKKKKAQINTKIITETVEIPIDYRMYKTKSGDWMVYDMVIEGVSLVGNYRTQFDQILQKESYDKLVADLKKKTDS